MIVVDDMLYDIRDMIYAFVDDMLTVFLTISIFLIELFSLIEKLIQRFLRGSQHGDDNDYYWLTD